MPTRKARRAKPDKVSAMSTKRISVSTFDNEDEVQERDIQMFDTDPAYVRVNAGVTKNLGKYESLRVDVSISVPCYQEMVEETFDAVAEKVSDLLADEVDNYLEQ